jgi:hypothetical protein
MLRIAEHATFWGRQEASAILVIWFFPKPTARSAIARGEGTNSARLFTPWERNALAKSKVYQ